MGLSWCVALSGALVVAAACDAAPAGHERGAISTRRVDDGGRVFLTPQEQQAVGLETAAVTEGALVTSSLRFGRVVARPEEDAVIVAPVTARLLGPAVALGAAVATGTVVAALTPLVDAASRASIEAQKRELRGQVEAARAQASAKKSALARASTLVSSGLATEAERAQAEAELRAEEARVESLTHAVAELARMTGGRVELRAPVAGTVVMITTEAGSLIQQGAIVARIVRGGPRWIDVFVPPADPVGSGYRVRGVSASVAASLLTRGAVVQPDGTRRDRLVASPDAATDLPPGATLAVDVLHEARGVLVPTPAIVRRGREELVFVEVEQGRYQPHAVEIVARDESRAVVAAGLTSGDRIVSRGAASLLGELSADAKEPYAGGSK